MQEVVGNVNYVKFDIEVALEQQLGAQPLPFPGMDKSGSSICTFYMRALCTKGASCPFRHVKGDRSVVCKHWLRGLCKKGDDCEFLHEYDMSKMPECYFFSKFGQCGNKECPFLHIDPEKKIKDCAWYDRGFCRHGPNCKNRHVRRVMCVNYLCGFCLDGPNCKYVHPAFDLPPVDPALYAKRTTITCHFCGEVGHKLIHCTKVPAEMRMEQLASLQANQAMQGGGTTQQQQTTGVTVTTEQTQAVPAPPNQNRRPLEEVVCFKCGLKGHYANRCPKGHLAFLSKPVNQTTSEIMQQQQQQHPPPQPVVS